eukprot:CAMPEP_0171197902 /NCGR_PEP_ID=MMETSP0790-20130122/22647_1 /TAXON_ID=2925 /ORGANISM="Alexandrium catenella, Strain OF101" /LENGTH=39 /DNA_ID= /DNA_START= /DNA_END= /DNA_ORIENTATION=
MPRNSAVATQLTLGAVGAVAGLADTLALDALHGLLAAAA